MGLLDEAIRDHLELKRRRGADPGEIAREEREALEPVFPDEPRAPALDEEPVPAPLDEAPPQGDPLAEAAGVHERFESEPHEPEVPGSNDPPTEQELAGTPGPDLSAVGLETAELDMEAVLEQDARLAEQAPAAAPGVVHETDVEDELLEWEVPDRSTESPPEPIPGQERLTFE
jgi:hypothetical protein